MTNRPLILIAALLAGIGRVSLPTVRPVRWAMLPLLAVLLTACAAPPVEHVSVPLPLPPRPELPAIPGSELQCLSDDAYRDIVKRDRARREYAEQLEAVIRSTHPEDDG